MMVLVGEPGFIGPVRPKPPSQEQRKCLEAGGAWNSKTQTCRMPDDKPEPEPTPEPITKPGIKIPETLISEEERLAGITIPGGGGKFFISGRGEVTQEEFIAAGGTGGRTFLGLSPSDVEAVAAGERRRTAQPEGTVPTGTFAAEQRRAADIAALIADEPVRRELDPFVTELEKAPVHGPLFQMLKDADNAIDFAFLGGDEEAFKVYKKQQTDPSQSFGDYLASVISPEELMEMAWTELQIKEIESGLTDSERFGAFAEALSIGEVSKWLPGIAKAEKPSENVQTIVSSLRQLKTRGRDIISNAESGDLTRAQAEERVRVIELELDIGEARIFKLIKSSPDLKFNSDGVNFIEGRILEVRIILQDAKIAAIDGPVRESQLTETKIVQKIRKLENVESEEDFIIPGL